MCIYFEDFGSLENLCPIHNSGALFRCKTFPDLLNPTEVNKVQVGSQSQDGCHIDPTWLDLLRLRLGLSVLQKRAFDGQGNLDRGLSAIRLGSGVTYLQGIAGKLVRRCQDIQTERRSAIQKLPKTGITSSTSSQNLNRLQSQSEVGLVCARILWTLCHCQQGPVRDVRVEKQHSH
jgi:hypothetical protein